MNNCQNHKKETEAEKFRRAVPAVFPCAERFRDFKRTEHNKKKKSDIFKKASKKIIHQAYKYELIQEETEEAFLQFIRDAPQDTQTSVWDELSFAEIIDEIKNLSPDTPTIRHLITELNPIAEQFGLDLIQAATFSRLKNNFNTVSAVNKATLCILTFWLAANHPECHWNYNCFEKFSTEESQKQADASIEKGIVTVFSVQSIRGVVKTQVIEWLRDELEKCIAYLHLDKLNEKQCIRDDNMSFISLRIPQKKGDARQPRLYAQAIQYSMAIVHQMICRWYLTEECLAPQKIIIGVYAGEFKDTNIFQDTLFELLPLRRSEIILNEFAYQCARLADVKIVFKPFTHRQRDSQKLLTNGWSIEYFQTLPYFEFIPKLLDKIYLPTSKDEEGGYDTFRHELYSPKAIASEQFKALSQMRQLPYNLFLIIEIVKVLIARAMFHEADEILTNFLIFEPQHILARTIRMFLYANLAAEHKDFGTSERIFKRAIAEGKFLTKQAESHKDPEVWCIFGLVYYSRAIMYLKKLREKPQKPKIKKKFFSYLKKAARILERGTVISHSGKERRPLFLEIVANGHLELFSKEGENMLEYTNPIQDRIQDNDSHTILRKVGKEYLSMIFSSEDFDLNLVMKRLKADFFKMHENNVLLRTFVPNIKYMFCIFLWDFMPELNMNLYKRIIELLEEAKNDADSLDNNLIIYSIAQQGPFPKNPKEFVKFIDYTLEKLEQLKPDTDCDDNILFDKAAKCKMSTELLHFLYLQWEEKKKRKKLIV